MYYVLACALTFILAYIVNITYISVFYHRGLAHTAVKLKPWFRKFVAKTGVWMTGLDPKGWSIMHRLHHRYSDTPKDPHSPVQVGVFGVAFKQLKSYQRILVRLICQDKELLALASDLDFPVSWINRHKLWILPYLLHLTIGVVLGALLGWALGICYFAGIMSHPLQGWTVNALGHFWGYETFKNGDNSKNNTLAAWLIMGEGYQNNHHRFPNSAKFSFRWYEIDLGYWLCKFFHFLGFLKIDKQEIASLVEMRRVRTSNH